MKKPGPDDHVEQHSPPNQPGGKDAPKPPDMDKQPSDGGAAPPNKPSDEKKDGNAEKPGNMPSNSGDAGKPGGKTAPKKPAGGNEKLPGKGEESNEKVDGHSKPTAQNDSGESGSPQENPTDGGTPDKHASEGPAARGSGDPTAGGRPGVRPDGAPPPPLRRPPTSRISTTPDARPSWPWNICAINWPRKSRRCSTNSAGRRTTPGDSSNGGRHEASGRRAGREGRGRAKTVQRRDPESGATSARHRVASWRRGARAA